MLLSQKLAGFTKGQADVLRKAMGKKDRKTLDKMKDSFIEGRNKEFISKRKIRKNMDRLGSICAVCIQ
jgi:DNA polymerase-3 subunit alpha